MFSGRRVLVAGGTGMIGRPLVQMLIAQGAHVRIASLDDPSRAHPQAEFHKVNLMDIRNCQEACRGMDFVFNLAGVKGSPAMTAKKPASFFVPTILFSLNLMEAARQAGVKGYLFTSSVGVYSPAEVFHEDDVWKTSPSENDRFAGWAKRMGELQGEAYSIEHGWDQIAIVRPANVYGPYDNFDPANAMVVPSLIRRALTEDPFVVWGDGSPIRDFIHAEDVARGMLKVMEKCPGPSKPVNLGSGKGVSIRELVEVVLKAVGRAPKVVWDSSKPSGDRLRLMDTSRALSLGFAPSISIEEGVRGTVEWYKANAAEAEKRYNVFREDKLV